MEVVATPLIGVLILEPSIAWDERGFFSESWSRREFAKAIGLDVDFVQDGQSGSKRGVLRGLHYQVPPAQQAKLVRVVTGSVFDVALDLRQSSPTFGQWFGVELSSEDHRQVWIPSGMAHGYVATSDWAVVCYKATAYYSPVSERAIRWDDPDVAINWPLENDPLLSEKDAEALHLRDAEVFA